MNIRYFLALLLLFPLQVTLAADAQKTTETPKQSLHVSVDNYTEDIPFETVSQWTTHDSALLVDQARFSEIENIHTCPMGQSLACDLLLPRSWNVHFSLQNRAQFNDAAIRTYLEDLSRKANHDPIDATFAVEDGRVTTFNTDKPGIALDIEKSMESIHAYLAENNMSPTEKSVSLPFNTSKSSISASEINNLGIVELIGEGKSNFRGSPANRIHNIKTATQRFNGILIKPGEEFSFVKTLGDVDGEHGYLPELVIKKNKTEPEFGGGVCQVSTTVFRAAIYAGLEITARRNHAYPVSYYNPQGMDSTIYIPKPDLRFINNTPGYILIQPKISGTELIIDFYGTNDGRVIEVDGPKIIESNPDRSIKTTFTQKVTKADGTILLNDTFNSSYDSPYKYPHPGDVMLTTKPTNWSDAEWETYKDAYKEANPPAKKKR